MIWRNYFYHSYHSQHNVLKPFCCCFRKMTSYTFFVSCHGKSRESCKIEAVIRSKENGISVADETEMKQKRKLEVEVQAHKKVRDELSKKWLTFMICCAEDLHFFDFVFPTLSFLLKFVFLLVENVSIFKAHILNPVSRKKKMKSFQLILFSTWKVG